MLLLMIAIDDAILAAAVAACIAAPIACAEFIALALVGAVAAEAVMAGLMKETLAEHNC